MRVVQEVRCRAGGDARGGGRRSRRALLRQPGRPRRRIGHRCEEPQHGAVAATSPCDSPRLHTATIV